MVNIFLTNVLYFGLYFIFLWHSNFIFRLNYQTNSKISPFNIEIIEVKYKIADGGSTALSVGQRPEVKIRFTLTTLYELSLDGQDVLRLPSYTSKIVDSRVHLLIFLLNVEPSRSRQSKTLFVLAKRFRCFGIPPDLKSRSSCGSLLAP